MGISPDSSRFTAFNTCFGTYKFSRLPQGLKTSSNSFQFLLDKLMSGLSFKSVLCYKDDILIVSETFDEHIRDLQEVFDRLRLSGLKFLPHKCTFAQKKCVFLGHEISKDGFKPPSDRLNSIAEYPVPKMLKLYLGLMNWFKKYIPQYSQLLTHCTNCYVVEKSFCGNHNIRLHLKS